VNCRNVRRFCSGRYFVVVMLLLILPKRCASLLKRAELAPSILVDGVFIGQSAIN